MAIVRVYRRPINPEDTASACREHASSISNFNIDLRLAPTASQKTSEEEKAEAKVDHVEKPIKGKLGKGDPHKVSQADLELGVPRGALPKTTRKTKSPVHGRNTNS